MENIIDKRATAGNERREKERGNISGEAHHADVHQSLS